MCDELRRVVMFRLVLGEARPHGDKKIYPALQAVAWTQLGDVSSPSNMENGDDALLGNDKYTCL